MTNSIKTQKLGELGKTDNNWGSDKYENTKLPNATIGHTFVRQPNHVEVTYIEMTIIVGSEIL